MADLGGRARRAEKGLQRVVRAIKADVTGFEGRVVWMLGSPRSGSSWLLQMLGEHDAVVPIDEPLIGWYLGPFMSDLPGGDPSALTSDTFTLRRVQRDKISSFFADHFGDVWTPALGSLLRDRFYVHARVHDAATPYRRRIVVIKEPNGSQSADIIMRAMPASRLLFLLRDGRDVVDSELAANLKGSWVTREFPGLRGISPDGRLAFVRQSAYKWLWRTTVVQEALARHRGPARIVRYEDLIAHPETELTQLFDWLGLMADANTIHGWVERYAFGGLATGATGKKEFFRAATPGAWRGNLSEEEQRAVMSILGPKLVELNYE